MTQLQGKLCRYGKFYFASTDELVGFCLDLYGEFSEFEVNVFKKVLRPGDTSIDVGANIGAFTVPMAQMVGPEGKVIAIEPGKLNAEILRKNLDANNLHNVDVYEAAASDQHGTISVNYACPNEHYPKVGREEGGPTVPRMVIDDLNLKNVKFIKIDVDGHELQVLRGARETIKRCQPMIYVENEHIDKSYALVAEIVDMGYRLYWYRPPIFNPDNWAGNKHNMFPHTVSLMNICVPEDSDIEIMGCDEVSDTRLDDEMFEREIRRFRKRLERKPDDLGARLLVGHYCNLMQREEEAYKELAENLRRDPNHVPTLAIKGLLDLQRGDWERGWPAYELRYQQPNRKQFGGNREFDKPTWDGHPTKEPVLIWCEQGFGDSIMFARFMHHVLKRAPNAFLETEPQLYELFEYSKISPNGLYRKGRTMPEYTFQCSLPSTPARLRADDKMIRMAAPYLFAEPNMQKLWELKGHPTIGFCAGGSPRSERPQTRDIPEALLTPLMRRCGPFVSLYQNGQFESFMDTAAAISSLDLVITVDTSIAHLAGAMGAETWLLLSYDPDFRWGLKGDSTIWYPTMRIFRQPKFRDWKSVVCDVEAAFEERMQRKAA